MSRKNKTLRAFLHQTQNPTIEQAWDAAWKHAQKKFHAKSMQAMEKQLEIERDYSKVLEKRIAALEYTYRDLLNDCINFDNGNLSDCILKDASNALQASHSDGFSYRKQAEAVASAPVAAQHRFRHPQKSLPDWSVWQPAEITLDRPSWEIDGHGFEVEYRLLYDAPQPAPDAAGLVEALEQCITSMLDSGYRADAVVIRAARTALAAHPKQEPSHE